MKSIIKNNIEIRFNNEKEAIEILDYFINNKDKILDFFELKELSKKLIIDVFDTIEDYSKYRNNLNPTSVGNMDFDNHNYYINILTYSEFIKRKGHENNNFDYLLKTIIHEFVHICHEEVKTYKDSLKWVKEGIAIFLSNQYEGLDCKLDNCSIDDLLNNKNNWYINYYSLIKYSYEKYGLNYIKKLVFNFEYSKEETTKLYNELLNIL